jgi:hypothetical protein
VTSPTAGRSPVRATHAARAPVALAVALALLACCSRGAVGQSIDGQVVELTDGSPLPGAFVVLQLVADSAEVDRVMTDALGRFRISVAPGGPYRLRAVAVGRGSWESSPFALAADESVSFTIQMPLLPVALPVLVVSADRRCRVRPDVGLAAGRLWEEARKVLDAVAWSERRGVFRHRLLRFERRREPGTLALLSQEVRWVDGVARGSPFVAVPWQLLDAEGYVRPSADGGWEFSAPDATVLLSDAFADLHCLAVAAGGEAAPPGLIGVTFEPVRERDVPDVEGVLWLDPESAELRMLDFRYTRIPWSIDRSRLGGRIVFRRLPQGPWIVEQWYIRMPELAMREPLAVAGAPRHVEWQVLSYIDHGGWVDQVRQPGGSVIWQARSAVIRGAVKDGADGYPVEDGVVSVAGSDRVARTDRDGAFRIDSLEPGEYYLVVARRTDDRSLRVQPPHAVTVGAADSIAVTLQLLSTEQVIRALCDTMAAGGGLVAGFVLSRDSATADRRVRISRGSPEGGEADTVTVEVTTDGAGFYRACGLPPDSPLRIEVEGGSGVVVQIGRQRVRRADLELRGRSP